MFGGSESITLRSGATLRCRYDHNPDSEVGFEISWPSSIITTVALDPPKSGVTGTELVVSPDERFVALFLYSMRSEQGYEYEQGYHLFALGSDPGSDPDRSEFRPLPRLMYVRGRGDAPRFSPDSRWLVMAVTWTPVVRDMNRSAASVLHPGAEGEIVVDWCDLYVQRMPDGAVEKFAIGTSMPASTDPDEILEWGVHDAFSFVASDLLVMSLPWGGAFEIEIPPAGPLLTPPIGE